jgi:hypothetical protein
MLVPSGLYRALESRAAWPFSSRNGLPLAPSHTRAHRSAEAVTTFVQFGLNRALHTAPACPLMSSSTLASVASQMRAVRSLDAEDTEAIQGKLSTEHPTGVPCQDAEHLARVHIPHAGRAIRGSTDYTLPVRAEFGCQHASPVTR